MDHHRDEWDPADLASIAARLRAERPEASPLELDEIKVRARRQAARPKRGPFMKSRLAIALVLTVGMLLSMTGVGLAVSGTSSSGSAATAEYPPPHHDPHPPSAITSIDPGTQHAAAHGNLPFTGYAAIPVLLGGIVLLGTGLVLRRRTRNE
jgi:hypothetical protein